MANGSATFGALTSEIDGRALRFSARVNDYPRVPHLLSKPFELLSSGIAHKLAFSREPPVYTLRGRTIATTVEVEVLDVAGARVGGDNGTSRVALTLHRGAATPTTTMPSTATATATVPTTTASARPSLAASPSAAP